MSFANDLRAVLASGQSWISSKNSIVSPGTNLMSGYADVMFIIIESTSRSPLKRSLSLGFVAKSNLR